MFINLRNCLIKQLNVRHDKTIGETLDFISMVNLNKVDRVRFKDDGNLAQIVCYDELFEFLIKCETPYLLPVEKGYKL